MRMGALGLLCILLFGLVAVWLRGVRLVSLLGSLLRSLVALVFGGMVLLVGLALRSAMLMLVFGQRKQRYGVPPLVLQGGHRERRLAETEDWHQHRGGTCRVF